MMMNLTKFALAVLTISGVSIGTLAAVTAPASAHVICDDDGDDCWRTHPDYYRDWNRDRYERREWEERRERDAYRRWYWSHRPYPYDWDRGNLGGQMWFSF